ncbi:hypothetical protein ANN_19596 [Periplaneta americana]|uniref:RING-type domain-containing protein n=1 Tax=Periplaneta americana TaxID=6978 RepID=A0ABQ8SAQ6_PERAM|nr:hypothetical protein ANN_19596 [Periplaneta americana]
MAGLCESGNELLGSLKASKNAAMFTMARTAKTIDTNILEELKCPVCMEYMKPPIRMCANAHNFCESCRFRLIKCPLCQSDFLPSRNIALENIAQKMKPCKSRTSERTESITEFKKYIECLYCLYVPKKCSLGGSCNWEGTLRNLKLHIRNDHATDISGAFRIVIHDLMGNTRTFYRTVITTLNELFILVFEVNNKALLCSVMYIGSTSAASNFKFNLIIHKDDKKCIHLCYTCESFLRDLDTILEPGVCASLHYDILKDFIVEENKLYCEMEIFRDDSEDYFIRRMDNHSELVLNVVGAGPKTGIAILFREVPRDNTPLRAAPLPLALSLLSAVAHSVIQ